MTARSAAFAVGPSRGRLDGDSFRCEPVVVLSCRIKTAILAQADCHDTSLHPPAPT